MIVAVLFINMTCISIVLVGGRLKQKGGGKVKQNSD